MQLRVGATCVSSIFNKGEHWLARVIERVPGACRPQGHTWQSHKPTNSYDPSTLHSLAMPRVLASDSRRRLAILLWDAIRSHLWWKYKTKETKCSFFSQAYCKLYASTQTVMKKALRETQTLRALAVVRCEHHPARPLSQTHRQDRLQYTAPQLASAQCN